MYLPTWQSEQYLESNLHEHPRALTKSEERLTRDFLIPVSTIVLGELVLGEQLHCLSGHGVDPDRLTSS